MLHLIILLFTQMSHVLCFWCPKEMIINVQKIHCTFQITSLRMHKEKNGHGQIIDIKTLMLHKNQLKQSTDWSAFRTTWSYEQFPGSQFIQDLIHQRKMIRHKPSSIRYSIRRMYMLINSKLNNTYVEVATDTKIQMSHTL